MNLMVGTDAAGRGGVASVINVLGEAGFLRDHDIKYVVSHSDGGAGSKLVLACTSFLTILGICAFSRPKVVHAHSASRASFYRKSLFLAVARVFKCKTIFHLHGAEFQQFARDESGPLLRWWIRRTLRNSTKVIALSDSWAKFLRQYAEGADVLVVANSVKLTALPLPSVEEHGRILFLGRVSARKGVFELLQAVSLLKGEIPRIKLVLGGDGDLTAVQAAARDLDVEDCVEFLGWVGPDQKAKELARASIFTLPSHDEGLPMAMLEAMSAGKAIVVTPVGGIPEAVKDGVNGLLVPPKDAVALAAALKSLLENQVLRSTLATNARKTIEERFSTQVVIAKLSSLYSELGGKN